MLTQIKVTVKESERRLFYDSETIAGKLERYLISKGKTDIGLYNPKKLKNGEVRRSYELLDIQRVLRTLLVKNMKKYQIEKWHTYENDCTDYLLCTSYELKPIIHDKIYLGHYPKGNDFIDYVDKYNKSHLPKLEKYDGYTIPQYFIYDLSFDGHSFNHSWDWNVFYGEPLKFVPPKNAVDEMMVESRE